MTDNEITERMAGLMGYKVALSGLEREAFTDDPKNYPMVLIDSRAWLYRDAGDTGSLFDPLVSIVDAFAAVEKWCEADIENSARDYAIERDGSDPRRPKYTVMVRECNHTPSKEWRRMATKYADIPRTICGVLVDATGGKSRTTGDPQTDGYARLIREER